MPHNFDDVGMFHEKFGLPSVCWISDIGPKELPQELVEFRIKFLQEELDEFIEGYNEDDQAKMADALIDLVYVAMGTAHFMGLPWQELWKDVQQANMRKVRAQSDGSNSKRGSSFDVVKPEGWVGPKTEEILSSYGWTQHKKED